MVIGEGFLAARSPNLPTNDHQGLGTMIAAVAPASTANQAETANPRSVGSTLGLPSSSSERRCIGRIVPAARCAEAGGVEGQSLD